MGDVVVRTAKPKLKRKQTQTVRPVFRFMEIFGSKYLQSRPGIVISRQLIDAADYPPTFPPNRSCTELHLDVHYRNFPLRCNCSSSIGYFYHFSFDCFFFNFVQFASFIERPNARSFATASSSELSPGKRDGDGALTGKIREENFRRCREEHALLYTPADKRDLYISENPRTRWTNEKACNAGGRSAIGTPWWMEIALHIFLASSRLSRERTGSLPSRAGRETPRCFSTPIENGNLAFLRLERRGYRADW